MPRNSSLRDTRKEEFLFNSNRNKPESTGRHTNTPVAREHQESLLLALHLQQGEKILAKTISYDPIDRAHEIVEFYNLHLAQHFEIEERILFPFIRRYVPTASDLIIELAEEHRTLEQMIDEFRREAFKDINHSLRSFGKLLENHIQKEDQQLFPIFARQATPKAFDEIEEQIQEFHERRKKPLRE